MKSIFLLAASIPILVAFFLFTASSTNIFSSDFLSNNIEINPMRDQLHSLRDKKPVVELPAPDEVKAIHLSYAFYRSARFEGILAEIENSDINSIIFEIKDPFGRVLLFDDEERDRIREVIGELHQAGIYTIARLVLFQDPALVEQHPQFGIQNSATGAPWQDYKGIVWADPTSRDVWEYNARIIRIAREVGFDEVNLDYIRFPTDGPLDLATYANLDDFGTRSDTIVAFLQFIRKEVGRDMVLSVDVFGMTFINDQDVIGQVIVSMAPFVDVIAPMPYPSHYPAGFLGYQEPAEYPYEVIAYTLEKGLEKLAGFDVIVRPWLQDFDLGAVYDDEKIRAQVQAIHDAGLGTWSLWNASNRYTFSAVSGGDSQSIDK